MKKNYLFFGMPFALRGHRWRRIRAYAKME